MSNIANFMHFIMTLITYGMWLPVWFVCAIACHNSPKNRLIRLQKEQNELLRKIAKEK